MKHGKKLYNERGITFFRETERYVNDLNIYNRWKNGTNLWDDHDILQFPNVPSYCFQALSIQSRLPSLVTVPMKFENVSYNVHDRTIKTTRNSKRSKKVEKYYKDINRANNRRKAKSRDFIWSVNKEQTTTDIVRAVRSRRFESGRNRSPLIAAASIAGVHWTFAKENINSVGHGDRSVHTLQAFWHTACIPVYALSEFLSSFVTYNTNSIAGIERTVGQSKTR